MVHSNQESPLNLKRQKLSTLNVKSTLNLEIK